MSEKSYFVRTCIRNEAGQLVAPSSHAKRFIWPEEVGSVVVAPDWDPNSVCGGGLHGLRPGDQIPGMWAEGPTAVWMICSYDPATAVVLEGKIKVPSCTVEYVVNKTDGASTLVPFWLRDRGVTEPIYRAILEDSNHATVGDQGCAIAGHDGKAKAGTWGIATSEVDGESHVGNWGYAISGSRGTSTAGKGSFAITQDGGTAIAGSDGIAYAGHGGRATAGDYGKAIVGDKGYAKAGRDGILQITWYQRINNCDRLRIAIGYVGENGIEPDTFYQIDGQGKFVKVET